jgi:hypothetical protein
MPQDDEDPLLSLPLYVQARYAKKEYGNRRNYEFSVFHKNALSYLEGVSGDRANSMSVH